MMLRRPSIAAVALVLCTWASLGWAQPALVNPTEVSPVSVPELAPVAAPDFVWTPPEDVPLAPDQVALSYLMRHGYVQPFAQNRFLPDEPMTRAQLVTLLYRASQMNTPFVSEFPYFRDVPTGHWGYVAFEGFRMRGILPEAMGQNGWLQPDKPITRLEAAVLLSRTFSKDWLNLTDAEVASTLKAFSVAPDQSPTWADADLARVLYAGLLTQVLPPVDHPEQGFTLDLNAPLKRMDGARMVYQRALAEEADESHPAAKKVTLPSGMTLSITPTSAISAPQLAVGQSVFFTTTQTVAIPFTAISLGRGSRLGGVVTTLSSDKQEAELTFSQITVPSGESYALSARLSLKFVAGKNGVSFRVPGEVFSLSTQ